MRRIHKEAMIDYSHYDEIFDNVPETIGTAYSELEERRRAYAIEHALDYKPDFKVPEVPELTPARIWKAPSTVKFFRSIVSHERNGKVTFWSRRAHIKLGYWTFFPIVIWGFLQPITYGIWHEEHTIFNHRLNIYDKLHYRQAPYSVVWSRPG